MDALELLLNRSSQPRLEKPAPESDDLECIMQAALRAPDHKNLKPWRFIVCTDKGLERLGEIFRQSAIENKADESTMTRASLLPQRAPMVVVAIADYKEDEKVPRVEQVASTACCVHSMQLAAIALGYQGVWRTGSYAKCEYVKRALGCKPSDEIVGFLYLGSSKLKPMPKAAQRSEDYFTHWRTV